MRCCGKSKDFTPHEFDLGRYALELVKERIGVELPEDEADLSHFIL